MTVTLELYCACRAWLARYVPTDDEGASLVEYALLVSLISVVCLAAVAFLGRSASGKFSNVASAVK
jgi:Flp pilus assembly pilin Flp